jgi:hypothetical protein
MFMFLFCLYVLLIFLDKFYKSLISNLISNLSKLSWMNLEQFSLPWSKFLLSLSSIEDSRINWISYHEIIQYLILLFYLFLYLFFQCIFFLDINISTCI